MAASRAGRRRCKTLVWCFRGVGTQNVWYFYAEGSNLAAVASFNAMKKLQLPPSTSAIAGDVVTYRIWSHVEFVSNWPLDPRIRIFYATGGNTTAGNNVQGVYVNIPRPKNYVRYVVRFIPES
ncbi:hypothetical protein [Spirosoma telluris]|uniref:hypothetical protein n=1 Tax=Spirosoma telluris TaxID=2183553 RepID=UPI002FC2CF45